MAALVPDALWAVVEPRPPPEPEKPKGGRPRASDRAALAGIILVLRTGMRTGQRGRPRRRPDKLHAGKGYDHRRCRRACRARSIMPRIARRGVESSERLGRSRWIVERTLAWLARFRGLAIRAPRQLIGL